MLIIMTINTLWIFCLIVVSIICQQPPPVVTTVLKIRMHCDACAQVIQKRIRKIKGTKICSVSIFLHSIDCSCKLSPCPLVVHSQQKCLNYCKIIELFSCTLFFL
jgi:copper chaperone CopZ